ncbi:enoyl-CoA hydratase/isomerase family protein [Celeribacter litoreus]|uniref:enoyl-CoA hydratase/isomerase family protein n=1 Tax=Celeribacter litoreus TaxID=2876714 RepID=UPI001CC9324A|nr:enoyl-CoA hydratase-related protein [Celeribacter litoreus]MCA0042515.1 enoyl-CoA hydratase/isomerase family protein [Celeribacter litoreus]
MTNEPSILLSKSGAVARLTLNRPDKLNALDTESWSALGRMVSDLDADPETRAIVVSSAGEKAFCCGADISEFSVTYATPESANAFSEIFTGALDALMHCSKPIIAEIDGLCVGGGCALIMACDLRYASDRSRFAITPTKIGAAYSFGDTNRLVQLVGPGRAKEMLFFAELAAASDACRDGLIDRVCASDGLTAFVNERAAKLASLSRNSLSVAKAAVNAIVAQTSDAPTHVNRMLGDIFSSDDFREGYSAFLEKRSPEFS